MQTAEIDTHEAPFIKGLTMAGALDCPIPNRLHLGGHLIFSGWVLSSKEDGPPVQLEIDIDGEIHLVSLDVERPDVISAVLGKENDVRLRCGFTFSVNDCQMARIFIVVGGRKRLWKKVIFNAAPRSELFSKLIDTTTTGFAHIALNMKTQRYIDSDTGTSDWRSATLITGKGVEYRTENPGNLDETAKYVLKKVGLGRGDFYQIKCEYPDGKHIIFKGCFGTKEDLKREFTNFEISRTDNSLLDLSTCEIIQHSSDITNLKKLLIRLRRAKRSRSWRGEFVGTDHKFIESDLSEIKTISLKYFSVVCNLVGVRYIWSLLDCIADYGSTTERANALAVSNYMHAERLAQSLKNTYNYVEKDEPITDMQLPYWGGMLSNQFSLDDSLDVFLTRAIEILSIDPLILAFFGRIMIASAETENSILGENIRGSQYFRDTFRIYRNIFEKHIEAIDSEMF